MTQCSVQSFRFCIWERGSLRHHKNHILFSICAIFFSIYFYFILLLATHWDVLYILYTSTFQPERWWSNKPQKCRTTVRIHETKTLKKSKNVDDKTTSHNHQQNHVLSLTFEQHVFGGIASSVTFSLSHHRLAGYHVKRTQHRLLLKEYLYVACTDGKQILKINVYHCSNKVHLPALSLTINYHWSALQLLLETHNMFMLVSRFISSPNEFLKPNSHFEGLVEIYYHHSSTCF